MPGEKGRDPPLLVVGTRSRAIRGGTSKEGANLKQEELMVHQV
jgi:hypothetical protein